MNGLSDPEMLEASALGVFCRHLLLRTSHDEFEAYHWTKMTHADSVDLQSVLIFE